MTIRVQMGRVTTPGSLGIGEDLWVLTHAACYDPNPVQGHRWTPPAEVAEKIRVTEPAWNAGFMRDPELCDDVTTTVPFDPKCTNCRRAARRVLTRRAVPDRIQQRLFQMVSAKWDWVTDEKRAARREKDNGVALIDPQGPGVVLDSTVKRRQAERQRRLVASDFKARAEARNGYKK
jgi:hypothetical protein